MKAMIGFCKAAAVFAAVLVCGAPGIRAYAEKPTEEAPEERPVLLRYNAEENFSDLGSPFWKYYHIDCDPDSQLKKLSVHGGGPQGDYAYDGSWVAKYKYVVDASNFISNEYHQYLGIWGGITMHPGNKSDVVLSFIAPVDGIIDIDAVIKAANSGSDGVKLYTTVNGLEAEKKIYPSDADYILHTSAGDTQYRLENYSVKRGDEIFFRLNKNETLANDLTYFSPTVSYTSYIMPDDAVIVIGAQSLTVPEGGIRLLEAAVNVDLGQALEYEYVSSAPSIVQVKNNGLLYGIKAGSAEITVTEKGSGYSAKCSVTVEKASAEGEAGGCGSSLGGGIAAVALVIPAAFAVIRKRKK